MKYVLKSRTTGRYFCHIGAVNIIGIGDMPSYIARGIPFDDMDQKKARYWTSMKSLNKYLDSRLSHWASDYEVVQCT